MSAPEIRWAAHRACPVVPRSLPIRILALFIPMLRGEDLDIHILIAVQLVIQVESSRINQAEPELRSGLASSVETHRFLA